MKKRKALKRPPLRTEQIGRPQLTLAKFIVIAESIVGSFLRPVLIGGFFMALAWLNVFAGLYPWAHLFAFVIFLMTFFDALGNAISHRKTVSYAAAKRRVEIASNLTHRPLDVIEDHPLAPDPETLALWYEHRARVERRLERLRWPKWMLDLSGQDPYALRHAMGILLVLGIVVGWGTLGGRLMQAINPNIGANDPFRPTIAAWITPPSYTGLAPILIATPADVRHDRNVIKVPEGSTITAHVVEGSGAVPELAVNNESHDFTLADDGSYTITHTIEKGDSLRIRRGWQTLGEWKISVLTDAAPTIRFKSSPSRTERHSIKFEYEAKDDYDVAKVEARITPHDTIPQTAAAPVTITLSSPNAKSVDTTDYADLSDSPYAGSAVDVVLTATDGAGHSAVSDTQKMILPEREFFHPVARTLVEQRKKLFQSPDDNNVRNETANIMAGVAQQPAQYGRDPVILMALRGGAVRLVLTRDDSVVGPVQDILWQTALRIEDGSVGLAEQALRKAQKELSNAIRRNASEAEIQLLIDKLQQAMSKYLSELSTRLAANPMSPEMRDLGGILGDRVNMLTPKDLEQMMNNLRNLSASGEHEKALDQLAQLENMLENMPDQPRSMSAEQLQQIRQVKELRSLVKDQEKLLNETFSAKQGQIPSHDLAATQRDLSARFEKILGDTPASQMDANANRALSAMQTARNQLQSKTWAKAELSQQQALDALQKAEQQATENLRGSMMMLGMGGMGGSGPEGFQEGDGHGFNANGQITLPSEMKAEHIRDLINDLRKRAGDHNRSKPERDYIERLLQNF